MLRRLYIDNYKSLVNFELVLGATNLLMGANGSGKTSVFSALTGLQRVVHDGEEVGDVFRKETITRWQTSQIQVFELDVAAPLGVYRYRLRIKHDEKEARVEEELLEFEGATLYQASPDAGGAIVDGAPARMLVDPMRSGLHVVRRQAGAGRVSWFVERLGRVNVVAINPNAMSGAVQLYAPMRPAPDFANFARWYLWQSQTRGPELAEAHDALREVLPGFYAIRLQEPVGVVPQIVSEWRYGAQRVRYAFHELSEGQRALIALYMLLYVSRDDGVTLAIDEPDNFVALPEIQPWINALSERPEVQTLLISHHPEIINLHAVDSGLMFRREDGGPTRVERFAADDDEELTPAELIARGWYRGAV